INFTSPPSYSGLGDRARWRSYRHLPILCLWRTSLNFLCSIGVWWYLSCTSRTPPPPPPPPRDS
ncbi:hypothetical protein LINPERHAP1_LOCUS44566, partial [Linum perenne]